LVWLAGREATRARFCVPTTAVTTPTPQLAAGPGTTITVEASGPQAAEVVAALEALVAGRFTEGE
jgi:hypothetical protein